MIFLIVSWSNFVYLLVAPGSPVKFLWSIALRFPHKMDAPDRHDGQTNKRVSLSVCRLDGVWHYRGLTVLPTHPPMELYNTTHPFSLPVPLWEPTKTTHRSPCNMYNCWTSKETKLWVRGPTPKVSQWRRSRKLHDSDVLVVGNGPQLKRAKHWWDISSYKRAGGGK